jgi:hypothetical protein
MGFSSKKDHEKAYGRGYNDAKKSDIISQFAHTITDGLFGGLSKSSTEKSYEAGYHDYWRDYWSGKARRRGKSKSKLGNRTVAKSGKGSWSKTRFSSASFSNSYDDSSSSGVGNFIGKAVILPGVLIAYTLGIIVVVCFIWMIVSEVYIKDRSAKNTTVASTSTVSERSARNAELSPPNTLKVVRADKRISHEGGTHVGSWAVRAPQGNNFINTGINVKKGWTLIFTPMYKDSSIKFYMKIGNRGENAWEIDPPLLKGNPYGIIRCTTDWCSGGNIYVKSPNAIIGVYFELEQ